MEMFLSLSKEQAVVIRQKLLETLNIEREKPVRNKISDAVAELARQYTENSELGMIRSLGPDNFY